MDEIHSAIPSHKIIHLDTPVCIHTACIFKILYGRCLCSAGCMMPPPIAISALILYSLCTSQAWPHAQIQQTCSRLCVCIVYCNSFHNNLEIPKVSSAPLRLVEIHRCPHHCSRHGSSRPSPCQFGFPMRTHWIPETPFGYICINLEAWKLSSWVNVTQNWFEWGLRN